MAMKWGDLSWEIPEGSPFSEAQSALWNDFTLGAAPELHDDNIGQMLFHEALFDQDLTPEQRDVVYDAMVEYMMDNYGIDFDDVFDWENFREWYGGTD